MMRKKNITGIQQIGIGVKDAAEAWRWYRRMFGMDISVFEDTATAKLMLPYTNNQQCERYAALAVNMQGGGGFEIWQHTKLEPKPPVFNVQMGDCGIFVCKIKSRDIDAARKYHEAEGVEFLGDISESPNGERHYYLKDPYNNIFEVIQESSFFSKANSFTAGVAGAVIGVSDIDTSLKVYADILEYDEVVYDKTGIFEDFASLPGGDETYRRILLKHSKIRKGPFSKLFGPTQIELVQPIDRKPQKIYKNRIWGELGFIHLCFDIIGMDLLEKESGEKGFPFTVNSAKDVGDSFDMGEAAGQFAYISDPDGTPIEFVETHKLPIVKPLGWYIDIKKRRPEKSLPNWILKAMKFNRIKD
ncbi:VOC family protein [Marinilabiliaceae bacterium ANBcel2]|nr:VOC family protein [Marinilabiliaceae bacterium ANBcel2]